MWRQLDRLLDKHGVVRVAVVGGLAILALTLAAVLGFGFYAGVWSLGDDAPANIIAPLPPESGKRPVTSATSGPAGPGTGPVSAVVPTAPGGATTSIEAETATGPTRSATLNGVLPDVLTGTVAPRLPLGPQGTVPAVGPTGAAPTVPGPQTGTQPAPATSTTASTTVPVTSTTTTAPALPPAGETDPPKNKGQEERCKHGNPNKPRCP